MRWHVERVRYTLKMESGQQRVFVPTCSAVDESDVSACSDPISHAFGMIMNFSLLDTVTKAARLAALFGQDPSTFISLGR